MVSGLRRGISSLTAGLMGVVVVAVAGILISQLYFNYAVNTLHGPGALIEYVDVISGGSGATLVIGIKNVGNAPITGIRVEGGGVSIEKTGLTIPPGGVYGLAENMPNPLSSRILSVTVIFQDGSMQSYTISLGPLGSRIGGGGEEEPEAPHLSLEPSVLELRPSQTGYSTLNIVSGNYQGRLRIMVASCPWQGSCWVSPDEVELGEGEVLSVEVGVDVPDNVSAGEYVIGIEVEDVDTRRVTGLELRIKVQYFALDVLEDRVKG
ncbi:MAG: hypothetical protein QXG25_02725, partial [Nitrososphaerota archaeon]